MKEAVEKALEEVRPMLMGDGGNIELVAINAQGVVLVRLIGACSGCPSATITLSSHVERILKERVKGVTAVQSIG